MLHKLGQPTTYTYICLLGVGLEHLLSSANFKPAVRVQALAALLTLYAACHSYRFSAVHPSIHPSIPSMIPPSSLQPPPAPEWHVRLRSSVTMFVFVPRKHEMNFLPPSKIGIEERKGKDRTAGCRGLPSSCAAVRSLGGQSVAKMKTGAGLGARRLSSLPLALVLTELSAIIHHLSGALRTLHNKLCVQGHINCHHTERET